LTFEIHPLKLDGRQLRIEVASRSHLKNRILVQDRGGAEFLTAGNLLVVEDLRPSECVRPDGEFRNAGKRGTNPAEKGGRPKDIFEMASKHVHGYITKRCEHFFVRFFILPEFEEVKKCFYHWLKDAEVSENTWTSR
jgi:hypothetical protein